jgi:hypothetical protein
MAAYASKLDGDATNGFRVNDKLMRDMIESAFTAIAHRCIGRNIISVDEAGKELAIYYRRNRKVMEKVDDLICVWLRHDKRRADELRLRILFSMPAVYIRGLEKTLSQKLFYLSRFWCVPGALKRLNDPSSIVSLWEEYCH